MAFIEDHIESIKANPTSYVNLIQLFTLVIVCYQLYVFGRNKYLAAKFGAKPAYYLTDHVFGINNAKHILRLKNNGGAVEFFHDRLVEKNMSTMASIIAGVHLINTNDPENIKALLSTQFNDFDLGVRHRQFFPLLGDGIFTLDAQGWKHSRAMLRPQFSREQIAHVKSLEPHMQDLFKHVRKYKGGEFDIQDYFFKLTIDTATEFLFGESVDSLADASIGAVPEESAILELKQKFPQSFNDAQSTLATRAVLQGFYFLIDSFNFRSKCKDIHDFTDYFVQKALDTPTDELNEKSQGGYVFLYELVKQTRDPKILRDQALNILLAGRDTTAGLLSFTFYELARNPHIWTKLRKEIVDSFGSGKDARIEEITFESLKKCEYLKAVINEALRLYPSVPINFRVANKHTTIPRGGGPDESAPVFVAKGQTVMYSVSSCHKNQNIYGKDADEFRPERWFEESTRKLGWAYLPFNGGPRICLGQQFALTETSYVITRLLQEFSHIESFANQDYPPKKNSQLTMNLFDGAHIALY